MDQDLNLRDQKNEQGSVGRNMSYTSNHLVGNRNNPYYTFHKNIHEELTKEIEASQIEFDGKVVQETLNSKIWDENQKLRTEVKEKLFKIAKHFYKSLNVNIKVKDIVVTGSMANYNWTKHSDIDLHLIIDYKEIDGNLDLVQEYLDDKKKLWEEKHDINFFGYDVELYAQSDEQQAKKNAAVYSIIKNNWIIKPEKVDVKIDVDLVKKKAASIINMIEDLPNEKDAEKMVEKAGKIKDRIKKLRQVGLEKGGEYGVENLAFKVLRNKGYLQKMSDISTKSLDKSLSLNEGMGKNNKIAEIAESVSRELSGVILNSFQEFIAKLQGSKPGELATRTIQPDSIFIDSLELLFGTTDIPVKNRFGHGSNWNIGGSYLKNKENNRIDITITFTIPTAEISSSDFKEKFLNYFNQNYSGVLVHELTHAYEFFNRSKKGEPEFHNVTYAIKNAFDKLEDTYPLNVLGRLFYLSSEPEINARVAQAATFIEKVSLKFGDKEVFAQLKKTDVWNDVNALLVFSGRETMDKIKQFLSSALEPGENINYYINLFILTIIKDIKDILNTTSYKNDGDFKKINAIFSLGDGEKTLYELEKFFHKKGELLKNRILKTISMSLHEEKIPGGKAKQKPEEYFDKKELQLGIKVEKARHTNSVDIAKEIAMDNLLVDPKYYTKLKRAKLAPELKESVIKEEKEIDFNSDFEDVEITKREKNILEIQKGIEGMTDEKIKVIIDFIKFCCQKMYIKNPVKVVLRKGRDEYIKTTASYLPDYDENHIRCGNRSLVDICRSIAHELTHNRQREIGMFKPGDPVQNIGGHIESQADTMAGILIKDFTHNHGYDNIYDI